MKSTFYISLIFLISISCRKKDLAVPFEEIQGDYEWFYSSNGEAFDVSDDQFGIRITASGRLKLFKNGELIEGYRITGTSVSTNNGNYDSNYTRIDVDGNEEDPPIFRLRNDTLWTWSYPHETYLNYYVKTK